MSDPVSNAEIEDVLSSIRRLVSEDPSPLHRRKASADAEKERFVLTPALRVPEDGEEAAEEDEAGAANAEAAGGGADADGGDRFAKSRQTLEQRIAELEAALQQSPDEWEPDGSEVVVSRAADMPPVADAPDAEAGDGAESQDPADPEDAAGIDRFAAGADAAEDAETGEHGDDTLVFRTADTEEAEEETAGAADLQDDTAESVDLQDDTAGAVDRQDDADGPDNDPFAAWNADTAGKVGAAGAGEADMPVPPVPQTGDPVPQTGDAAREEAAPPDDAPAQTAVFATEMPDDPSPEAEAEATEVEAEAEATGSESEAEAEAEDAVAFKHAAFAARPRGAAHAGPGPESGEDDAGDVADRAGQAGRRAAGSRGFELFEEDAVLDEEALRDMVSQIVRDELQGVLGERITRNVRRLVRREIQRAIAMRDLE